MTWQPRSEKRLVQKYNGTHNSDINKGDGYIRGKVVEVKEVRKDHRFRINKDNHKYMVRNNGSYIFSDGSQSKRISAKKVSKLAGNGGWFKDRSYPHKFINKNKIFNK